MLNSDLCTSAVQAFWLVQHLYTSAVQAKFFHMQAFSHANFTC